MERQASPPLGIGHHPMSMYYPVHHQIDAPATTDLENLDCLRVMRRRYESEKAALGIHLHHHKPTTEVNSHLASLLPSELPSSFVAAATQWISSINEKSWRTQHGIWKEKNCGAVRRGGGAPTPRRCYVGVKRRLDFQLESGAKTEWTMTQYYNLRVEEAGYLVIEDEMILCEVFKLNRDAGQLGSSKYSQAPLHPFPVIPGPLPEYTPEFLAQFHEDLTNFNPEEHPIYEDVQLDGGREQTTTRRSGVWEHFTRIHSKDPNDVYAACHMCDGMLKAHSRKNGTSQLWRHYTRCKHLPQ